MHRAPVIRFEENFALKRKPLAVERARISSGRVYTADGTGLRCRKGLRTRSGDL
jgi:hypothetical protein